jgi:flagellar biosynthesis regulator FlbT
MCSVNDSLLNMLIWAIFHMNFIALLLFLQPNTQSIVSKALKREYVKCLRQLTEVVETDRVLSQTIKLQELLGEAQRIMEELGAESNGKK